MSEFDVLVAGGGNAGLCAALAARDAGASVMLIERSPRWRRGGNSRHTRDIRYAHDQSERWATTPYPATEFSADLEAVTNGSSNRTLSQIVIDESVDLPAWMETHGVKWQPPLNGTLHLSTNRFFLGGGRALINTYYDTAKARGIGINYESSVVGLSIRDGTCSEVTIESAGRHEAILVGAVVVASGGLEANGDWLQETWGPGATNFFVRGTPDNDGSLLLELLRSGAKAAGTNNFHCIAVDSRSPKFDGGIVTRIDSIPLGLVVNKDGERFYDEGEDSWPKRYAQWGQLIAQQPDQRAYSIFDSQAWGSFIPPAYPPLSAATLPDLVRQLDVDQKTALSTIERFNRGVDTTVPFNSARLDGRGSKGITPPRSNWARAVHLPPFYAFPLAPGLTFTYAGVAVDETARVCREEGPPFANVFAAGETMAGNILTSGYLAGFGLTIGSVFGRIAGREAARHAL